MSDYIDGCAMDDGGRFKLAPDLKKSNACSDWLRVQFSNEFTKKMMLTEAACLMAGWHWI